MFRRTKGTPAADHARNLLMAKRNSGYSLLSLRASSYPLSMGFSLLEGLPNVYRHVLEAYVRRALCGHITVWFLRVEGNSNRPVFHA